MIPTFEESRRTPLNPNGGPPLELDSDFGALEGDAYDLVERRYGDRGLAVTRERYSSRSVDGDIVCTGEVTARSSSTPVALSSHVHPTAVGPSSPATPGVPTPIV